MSGVALGFAVAGAGVAAFLVLGLPLPWLLGPITAGLLAALLGLRVTEVKPLSAGMRTILGVAVGTTLTPTVVASLPGMWSTLILIPPLILAIGLLGVPYFERFCGYDRPTAYYAAMPGGLQDMLVFGEEAGANVRAMSLIHATRVTVIVVALPFLLKLLWASDLSAPPGAPASSIPPHELLLMVFCGLFGWWAAVRVGLFGATILGPLIVAAAVTLAGGLHFRPPAEAIWAAQFFIGITISAKYAGITMAEIRRDVAAGLGFCLILLILTVIWVETIVLTGLATGREALLAFAPGGQAELTVLALIVGADAAFVVAHHVVRLILVITGAPLAMRLWRTRG